MFRTDVTTAAGTLPTPAAPGTPGFFTNGNPALGVPATIVDQDWLNRFQEELMSLLQAAAITPVKSNYSQVLAAIRACFTLNDVGVVNVLVANPSPPMTSLVIGTQMTLVPAFTNTSTATLNVSSLGALALLRPDATVLQPGDAPAGRRIPIIYDGSAWRLVNFPSRIRLGGALTLFCNPQTGNDSNNGLTSGTAFASLNGVWNYLYSNIDVTGQTVTVQCSGNFTAGLTAQTVVVGTTPQSVIFNFASGATITVTNGSCFLAAYPGVGFSVTGPVVISATGTGTSQGLGVSAQFGAQIFIGGVNFGACAVANIDAEVDGQVANLGGTPGNYSISASSPIHWRAKGGTINITAATITITGTPAFSAQFAQASDIGSILAGGNTYSGSATGTRFLANFNGVIDTNTAASATTLPGNAAGSTATGGQYN